MRHTQGEWAVMPIVNGLLYSVVSKRECASTLIANVGHDDISDKEAEANAKLIAAAPDMLEALKSALPFMENDIVMKICADAGNNNALWLMREAINKATL